MTKITACLLFAAAFWVPTTVLAQEEEEDDGGWSRRIIIGGHAGIDFANTGGSNQGDDSVEVLHKAGFTGGGVFILRLTPFLAVQSQIDFTAKGQRFDTGFPSTSSRRYIGYLEVPVLVRGSLPMFHRTEPYVALGPALGILLDAEIRYDDGRFFEARRIIEPVDIGLMAGAGVAINVSSIGALVLDIRYNLGLRNSIKNATSEDEAFNRAIYLTVGYRADLATLGRLFGGGSR